MKIKKSSEEGHLGSDSSGTNKDETKSISLRIDLNTDKKIKMLERTQKTTKSAVIKNAIDEVYSKFIVSSIHNQLFSVSKKVFNKVLLKTASIMTKMDDGESKEKTPFMCGEPEHFLSYVDYRLDYPEYEHDEKTTYCLNALEIEVDSQGAKTLKIKVSSKNIIRGSSNKIKPDVFFEISKVASRYDLQTETRSDKKDSLAMNMFFERTVDMDSDTWIEKSKEDLKSVRCALDEINEIFSKDNTLKKKDKKEPDTIE